MRETARAILQDGAVIPALPLFLREDRSFDEQGQRRLVRYYLRAGAGGLAVAVHTTQFEIREAKTRLLETVARVAREEIAAFEEATGRTILTLCGVCGETPQAVAEAKIARDLGYDAVLLSPGGLNGYTERQFLSRTRAVGEVMPVVAFYLQRAVGGRAFSFAYWEELCCLPAVVAVKVAPFDRYSTLDVARAASQSGRVEEIALYTGNDDSILIDLLTPFDFGEGFSKVRFVGGLLGHWAVWTHTAVELYRKARALRGAHSIPPEMLTLAAQITDANAAFFDAANGFAGCIAGIHEVLRRQGLMRGIWTLNPKEGLSPGQAAQIDRVYRQYPHLNDDAFVRDFLRGEGA